MADIDPSVQRLLEALDSVSDSIRSGQDAFEDSRDKSQEVTRKLDAELRKLGLTLKTVADQEDDLTKKRKERAKLEEEVNTKLKESGRVRSDATQAEIEHYKNTQKQNILFESTLASMGRYIDANNKIVKSTVDLSAAQQKTVDKLKQQDQAKENFEKMIKDMPKTLLMFGARVAFELLTASIMGTYRGMVAYQDALLDGQRGQSVEAAQAAEQMKAFAAATERIGGLMMDLGSNIASVGLAFATVNPLIGLLTAAIGGLIAFLGYEKQLDAEVQKRQAELEVKRARLNDDLYASFQKLSGASLTGAKGMMGVYDDLHKFGLTIKEFDKFGKVLQENTKNLALFGAGTVDGVKKFTDTASRLVQSGLGKVIETMGITVEEQMSHTAAYMTQQARFGLKSTKDQSEAAGKYIIELDKLAVLTGATRKEQEDGRKAILSINQLRSAMIQARENKDFAKAEEYQRALETTGLMHAKGMIDEAGALARRVAAGGVVDADTARMQQMYGGPGGLLESFRTGKGSQFERFGMATKGSYEQEARFAGTTKLTGTLEGVTSKNVGAVADAVEAFENFAKVGGPKSVKAFEEYVENQRKVTNEQSKAQTELERRHRAEAVALETKLMNGQNITAGIMSSAGNTMLDAAKKMLQASVNFLKGTVEDIKEWWNSKDRSIGGQVDQENTRIIKEWWNSQDRSVGGKVDQQNMKVLKEFFGFGDSTAASGGSASTYSRSGQSRASGTGGVQTTAEKLARAGLILRPYGDVQKSGAEIDDRLIDKALELQLALGENFGMFTSFNDQYHQDKSSDHKKGIAVDFTLKRKPTVEEGKKLVAQLKAMGFVNSQDEYNFPSPNATGDHIHAALAPKAFHGGVFDGPMSGYQVEMHGREAIVPLNDPASRLKSNENVSSQPLSTVSNNNSGTDTKILTELFGMMEDKFDEMIRKLDTGNGYADKLVKAMV